MMTDQEAFNTVCDHLMAQGAPCEDRDTCRYRHNGMKCAIEDEIRRAAATLQLLGRLQAMHDNFDPKEWPDALYGIATAFGLTIPASIAKAEPGQ